MIIIKTIIDGQQPYIGGGQSSMVIIKVRIMVDQKMMMK